jgi:glycosyltransferase involved in cell wall biosynthesis
VYPRASVVVAPCVIGADGNRDRLPTVVVEAMALGVPVVATDVTGIPELVEDGRTGLLVPPHQPEALAAAIRRVLSEPAWADALVRAGRGRVEREFDLEANVARLRALLEEAGIA